eukprot:gene1815-2037_t
MESSTNVDDESLSDSGIKPLTKDMSCGTEEIVTSDASTQSIIFARSKATQTQHAFLYQKKEVQVSIPTCNKGVKTSEEFTLAFESDNNMHNTTLTSESGESDDEWKCSDSSDASSTVSDSSMKMDYRERKFLVFESCPMTLFSICSICLGHCQDITSIIIGSCLKIRSVCINGHLKRWSSQPHHGDLPMGNFLIAASTLFSGCQPAKILTFFNHLHVPCITERTYVRIQRIYLVPTIFEHWNMEKRKLLLSGKNIKTLGGDARMDSPGFSAKYGTYSLMDLDSNKVISVNTLQRNEVGGSTHMELAGLKSGLEEMEEHGINFQTIVTDRHGGVKKYMREQKPKTKHRFDVFHVPKSIGKKVEAIGKKKKTVEVKNWVQSIKNHVYWCASSSDDNAAVLKEKWVLLAALHFNENANREQLATKKGEKRWRVSYLRYKDSGVVKAIRSKSTYDTISSSRQKQSKPDLVAQHKARFVNVSPVQIQCAPETAQTTSQKAKTASKRKRKIPPPKQPQKKRNKK